MINYLGKFIENLSSLNKPLRTLLEKDVEWHWDEPQRDSFKKLKAAITSAPVLSFYDKDKDLVLSVDSSRDALGACIMQEGHPIAYASRSLNRTEQNYAQIEKEMAAIVFGATKFHDYIYGRPVTVESDHKPLESIMKKPICAVPPRIQRMLFKVQKYDMKVQFKPGKEMYIADTLSRTCTTKETDPVCDSNMIVFSVENLPISNERLSELQTETQSDLELVTLKDAVLKGWPKTKDEVDQTIKHYWNFRDEISYIDGLLLKGEKVIIPKSMQKLVTEKIHKSHMGIQKCISRARDVFYWSGMVSQIKDIVSQCAICNEFRNAQSKEPMKPHEMPNRPWEIVATDLFELDKEIYVVLVDYYSKFFEVSKVQNSTSKTVIGMLKQNFCRYGIPLTLKSDNGPAYVSSEFKEFVKTYGFEHITSSPRYAQSNGLAERTVQTVKNLLKKAKKANTDPYLAIMEFRNTPIEEVGMSPSQLLMGRRTRTQLPVREEALNPSYNSAQVKSSLKQRQIKQKKYYDRNTKSLQHLNPGDQIRVRQENTWQPGVVVDKAQEPRSYNIRTERGQCLRRNRRDLLKTSEKKETIKEDVEPEVFYECPENVVQNESTPQEKENGFPPPSNIKTTSSGRVVNLPRRYEDFVMS